MREELFGEERLAQHARSLASAQDILPGTRAGPSLALRLKDNAHRLMQAYEATAAAAVLDEAITPAAEWLLDNYYLVDEQVSKVRDDLPPSFYRQLPKLSTGPFAGYPRVFGIAWAFVAHTDSRSDPDFLCHFMQAYQTVQPLTIGHKRGGELWIAPCTPRAWSGFTAVLRHGMSSYGSAVNNPHHVCRGVVGMSVDGKMLEAGVVAFPLLDDGARHSVIVTLGPPLD